MKPKVKVRKLRTDKFGRAIGYYAEWSNGISKSSCIFTRPDVAIFFVVSGLGNYVDWKTFPDPTLKYPYEERTGNEKPRYDPMFVVTREKGKIYGIVREWSIADNWTVGNGIAEQSAEMFYLATGRDLVKVRGKGQQLHATVK